MISSGPGQFKNRETWRGRVRDRREVKVIFLVAKPQAESEGLQKYLEEEHEQFGDLLQSSIVDGHRRLGYKILTGYVWSYLSCGQVGLVGKTDDNVVLDLETLLTTKLEGRRVLCGSGTPHRNMKPLRSDRTHMTGNWSISRQQLDLEFHPDFCSGFLYLTSPQGMKGSRIHLIEAGYFSRVGVGAGWARPLQPQRGRGGADRGQSDHRAAQGAAGPGEGGVHQRGPALSPLAVCVLPLSMALAHQAELQQPPRHL